MGNSRSPLLVPDRETLIAVLKRWQGGEINHWCVVEEAEAIADSLWDEPEMIPTVVKSDPGSIALVVLCILSTAYIYGVLPVDIPALLEFLETPEGEELSGWERFEAYWAGANLNAREREVNSLNYGR
jgi:hypothetical protein